MSNCYIAIQSPACGAGTYPRAHGSIEKRAF